MNIHQSEEFRKSLKKLNKDELIQVKELHESLTPKAEDELFLIEKEFKRREKARNYASYLH